jgi:uncharacterized surface protein with fasciclin (FAS1) repeats
LTLQPNKSPLPDFTFFAPTDDAIRAAFGDSAPASIDLENATIATIKNLSGDPLTAFTNRLKYHIVTGRVLTSDISDEEQLTTLLDSAITVDTDGGIFLQDLDGDVDSKATVTSANNLTNAGVIHRINYFMEIE